MFCGITNAIKYGGVGVGVGGTGVLMISGVGTHGVGGGGS